MVNVEYASCSLMMGIPTKEWDEPPYTGLMFFQTSSKEVLHMEPLTDKPQELFSCNKRNTNIMRVVDTILDAALESGIDKNWFLIDNQSA